MHDHHSNLNLHALKDIVNCHSAAMQVPLNNFIGETLNLMGHRLWQASLNIISASRHLLQFESLYSIVSNGMNLRLDYRWHPSLGFCVPGPRPINLGSYSIFSHRPIHLNFGAQTFQKVSTPQRMHLLPNYTRVVSPDVALFYELLYASAQYVLQSYFLFITKSTNLVNRCSYLV